MFSTWHARCKQLRGFTLFTRFTPLEIMPHYRWATMALNETSQKGLKDGWTRATFILRKDYLEKLKSLSYWQRKKIKDVIDEALRSFLDGKKIRKKMSR